MKTEWDYDRDVVTVFFDPEAVSQSTVKTTIEALGYTLELAANAPPREPAPELKIAPIDDSTPKFLRDAFEATKASNRILVVDFWAEWCAPCKRLKTVTLQNPEVALVLEKARLVYVDLDRHPALGKAFGVTTIPDVFFIHGDGRIIDRLRGFEPPAGFLIRLKQAFEASAR